ncbi:11653_t:CDS:2, partial [Gigaspora margarita]
DIEMGVVMNNKVVKGKSHVQRTSYKASEKLAIIQEAEKIATKEEFVRWLNELRQMGIAVMADSIKCICSLSYQQPVLRFSINHTILDVSINKPFKDILKKKEQLWMSNGEFQSTKQGNLKRPSYSFIKSFKKCGISNELDGIEDDLLYSSDKENGEIDNNDDSLEIVEKDNLSADELELEE